MNVDRDLAEKILNKAFNEATKESYKPSSPFAHKIKSVILGDHLTFRYILVTALLGKATNNSVNPLALQARASLKGAYDARSLCHSVVVPFEREKLLNALGGSNEPFLNKPARQPSIDPINPVRRGRDKQLLYLLCDFLPKIDTSVKAYIGLCDALHFASIRSRERLELATEGIRKAPDYIEMERFILDLVSDSYEGESLALAVGGLLSLLKGTLSKGLEIFVHPVNECGASSNQVGDIDVYLNGKIINTAEVKDKRFSYFDVTHAVDKTFHAQCDRMFFIIGPAAVYDGENEETLIDYASSKGIYLSFFTINKFVNSVLSLMAPMDTRIFYESIRKFALTQKFKQLTIAHLKELATRYSWV